jgi:recombination protein RecT
MSNQLAIKDFMSKTSVQAKFQEILGQKSKGFVTSVLQVVNNNKLLANADPQSIMNSAMMGACLDLPINNNLGFAYIVPYGNQAQFQLGYKGLIQLAQRTGQYKAINSLTVYENQFISYNHLTEELEADFTKDGEGQIVGFCAYFKMVNGFEKTVFWTKSKIEQHGAKFSKTFKHSNGVWSTNYEAMAQKTVLKNALSKWGILSIEMQNAIISDQSVIKDIKVDEEGTIDIETQYVDNSDSKEVVELEAIDDETLQLCLDNGWTLEQLQEKYALTEAQIQKLSSNK